MSKFLQLTVHAHTTQLHFAPEKSLIHSSQQMIIELDKKLTLLPHPHPSSLLFLTLKKLFGISPWDISLSFCGVCFSSWCFALKLDAPYIGVEGLVRSMKVHGWYNNHALFI
jgi:hypothetical protein